MRENPPKIKQAFLEEKVNQIMETDDLPLIEKTATIDQVLPILIEKNHMWIIEGEERRKIVGVITEKDFLDTLTTEKDTYTFSFPDTRCLLLDTAEDIMTKEPTKCSPEETVEDVLNKMMQNEIRRLPVTNENSIITGELCLCHLIEKFSELLEL